MKHNLDYMIAVMQAAKEGKEIQYKENRAYSNWYDTTEPTWDWMHCDYCIKPEKQEPKLVPYESAEEFLQAQKEHGPYLNVCSAANLKFILPIDINEDGIVTSRGIIQYNELCEECPTFCYTWQDDTPCGKLEQQ